MTIALARGDPFVRKDCMTCKRSKAGGFAHFALKLVATRIGIWQTCVVMQRALTRPEQLLALFRHGFVRPVCTTSHNAGFDQLHRKRQRRL